MRRYRMSAEQWGQLEPLLRDAEQEADAEFFAEQGGVQVSPGTLLLRHLMQHGDVEGIMLLRAAEMHQHELSRAGYAAAFILGKSGGAKEGEGA